MKKVFLAIGMLVLLFEINEYLPKLFFDSYKGVNHITSLFTRHFFELSRYRSAIDMALNA